MKATKKIVGAACALVAAVALSAGTTFAWFAANGTVTADGLTVSANTDVKYLVIDTSATKPTTEQTSVKFATQTAKLNLVAHKALTATAAMPAATDAGSSVWYTDVSTKSDNSQTNSSDSIPTTMLTLTTDSSTGEMYTGDSLSFDKSNVYVLKQTFYLWWYNDKDGSSAESGTNELSSTIPLYCSYNVTTASGSDSIPGVLDAVFEVETGDGLGAVADSATYMCGNVAASNDYGSNGSNIDQYRTRTYTLGNVTISSYTPIKINVYIYINGEDADAKSTNAAKLDGLELKVAFSTESKSAAIKTSGESSSGTENSRSGS